MIILFRPNSSFVNTIFEPIVILDYTRSDEQWTQAEIQKYVKELGTPLNGIIASNITTYSLDYAMTYTHNGINYGNSLKTNFTATIRNAPMTLVNLLNIKQYTSQQNINALKQVINNIIDPQVQFPQGGFVIKSTPDVNGKIDIIKRTFIIYSSPFDYDAQTRNSTLILHGASFDSMVIRLKFAFNIKEDQLLYSQMKTILAGQNISLVASASVKALYPVLSKYYAPAPLNEMIQEICYDNNLAFDFDKAGKTVFLQSLSPSEQPSQDVKAKFNFQNYVNGAKLMMTFKPDNYASATWEGELYDAQLFTSVAVYDDSFSQGTNSTGALLPALFSTFTKIPNGAVKSGSSTIEGYRFYVQAYTYYDSREKTSMVVTGTNNWVISIMRIDSLLENAIYKNQL